MDLYSSNVGQIHGNMRNDAISSYNRNVINNNNQLATTIQGLKEQQKENEYLSSAKNLVSSAYSGGAYATKLAEHKAFTEAGGSGFGIKQAYRNLRANPEKSLESISNRVVERVNPEGVQNALSQATSPLDEHIGSNVRELNPANELSAEGRTGITQAEHVEEMGSSLGREGVSAMEGGTEALASTGKWVGRVGKGLGIAGGIATGGMAIADDFKGGSFHIAGENTAEQIANVGQIIGAGLDVAGTIAPPLALLGGAVDIISGIIGGAGNIAEGKEGEKAYDTEQKEKTQKTIESGVVGAQQITTGRTI